MNSNKFEKKLWKKSNLRRELLFFGKIMLEIILTKTKVVSTGSDNSRMKNLTFSIKNVKIILSWPAPLARWSYQSLGQAQNFHSEAAPVIKHEVKIKNNSWLFLIWEIIKKITHYYFNKKFLLNLSIKRKMKWKYEEQFP